MAFALLALPGRGAAQEPARLSLPEAVERALAQFPSVEAARARGEEAAAAVGEARAGRGPRGRVTGSVTQYQEPMVVTPIHGFGAGLFPEFDETLGQATLTVSYTLFDSGATAARVRSAGAQRDAAGAALGSAEQLLARRVAAAFLTAVGQRQVVLAHDQRLEALRAELSRVQLRFEVGRAAQVEVLRAEAAVASAEAERVRLAAALDNSERELARLIAAPVEETRSDRLARVEIIEPQTPVREVLIEEGIAVSPAVAQARAQVLAAEAQVAIERAIVRPDLRAVGNYNEWTSSQGNFTGEWNAGFQVTVPLFDGGVTRSRIARAEAAHRAAQEQVRLAEIQVREEVDRAAAALEEAEARGASLAKAVERSTEVVRIQKLLLDEGAGTQTDYLSSEAELLTARASLADARHAAILARVDLARAAGMLTPEWLRANLSSPPGPLSHRTPPDRERGNETGIEEHGRKHSRLMSVPPLPGAGRRPEGVRWERGPGGEEP
ncbi:MAG TPA: TolC family protein [Thermoanaerobaculia bacterium]|nr:TolC family protein [Thermoanaerobaculia bacterium]